MKKRTIMFTDVQKRLIKEVLEKSRRELNDILILIYKELGILEKVTSESGWSLLPKYVGVEKFEFELGDVEKPFGNENEGAKKDG